MNLKLIRLGVLTFNPPAQNWTDKGFTIGSVRLKIIAKKDYENPIKQSLLVAAEIPLKNMPNVSQKNVLEVPEKERKEAEFTLEVVANLISVSEMCERHVSSPTWPAIAFMPENKTELKFLNKTKGIDYNLFMKFGTRYSLQKTIMKNLLLDRVDGVAMLAEAHSQNHSTGKLHEFVRFFERAFGLSSYKLVNAMSKFFSNAIYGYTKNEIKNWIITLRDPATHADRGNRIVMESDVRPHIDRIEQAVYDVLFNKVQWHNPSTKRRKLHIPIAGTSGVDMPFIKIKTTPTIVGQTFDPFKIFPSNFNISLTSIPKGWWIKIISGDPSKLVTKQFPLDIVKDTTKPIPEKSE